MRWLLHLVFFLSGFAGLTYEVLWQRELGLLFGNTTEATATTLAVFFLGLAIGSWLFGRRCGRWARPVRAFGILELLVGVAALLLPLLLPLYRSLFAPLYSALGDQPELFLLVKFLLSTVVLAPPAILMGGTLPVLTEAAVRGGNSLSRAGILLYAVNTTGAMLGAALAGFVLPAWLGYRGAYIAACSTSLLVGLGALLVAPRLDGEAAAPEPLEALPNTRSPVPLLLLAALSGFIALGLEVLWTRMAALAIVNSVYSFAAVLVLFLLALALGAAAARALARRARQPAVVMQGILIVAGLGALFSGTFFRMLTGSPPAVGKGADWWPYVLAIAGVLAGALVPAALAVGLVFPYLLKLEEGRGVGSAGARLGRLASANTLGALLGALAAGFLLPRLLGLWASISLLAGLYGVMLLLVPSDGRNSRVLGVVGSVLLVALALVHGFSDGAAGDRWDLRENEIVIARYEGSAGAVRVVRRSGALKLRLNNSYTLGGTGQPRWEHYQAHVPLCLHPDPKRVFFLGMGTGITAGAALHHDVTQVRVAEIVPEAVRGAREHFEPWLNGLFEDRRTEVVVEDARTLLHGLDERYDVVVGDLFLPWRRGTALLYTVEQFEAVKARLAPGGLFAQWLPLYQLSQEAFDGIIASFIEVFGEATVWRGDFFRRRPIVALIGRVDNTPWDGEATAAAWARLQAKGAVKVAPGAETLPFLLYAGRVTKAPAGARRITDDRPWLEFHAPIAQRARAAGAAWAFTGRDLARYQRALFAATPVDEDPFLAALSVSRRGYVRAGMHLYDYAVLTGPRRVQERAQALDAYHDLVPPTARIQRGDWVR